MACYWAWTFSYGLTTLYYSNSSFGVTNAVGVTTNNNTNLSSPVTPGIPGDEFNCAVGGGSYLTGPPFPGGALTEGWALFRWNLNGANSSASSLRPILNLLNAGTIEVQLRFGAVGNPAVLNLYLNGSLIGTTVNTFGDAEAYLALDFDLTVPEVGLVVNGAREIARASSGAATSIDRWAISGGGSNSTDQAFWGDVIFFDQIADLAEAETQDVWCALLSTDSAASDGNWSPSVGVSLVDVVADHDGATYDETTTDPSVITFGFEATTDREPGWAPATIYYAATVAYGTADVITNTTLELRDSGGVAATRNMVLSGTGDFVYAGSAQTSALVPWDVFEINAAEADYTVST